MAAKKQTAAVYSVPISVRARQCAKAWEKLGLVTTRPTSCRRAVESLAIYLAGCMKDSSK